MEQEGFFKAKQRSGFTLIELLVSIVIIGILVALLVPTIDRNLQRGQLSGDVEVIRSKLEYTRLLAGSTQQIDEPGSGFVPYENNVKDPVGYYALYFANNSQDFMILRLTNQLNSNEDICSAKNAIKAAPPKECLVERVAFSRDVKLILGPGWGVGGMVLAYKPPMQQLAHLIINQGESEWREREPVFQRYTTFSVKLTYGNDGKEWATLTLLDYSAKIDVKYEKR